MSQAFYLHVYDLVLFVHVIMLLQYQAMFLIYEYSLKGGRKEEVHVTLSRMLC